MTCSECRKDFGPADLATVTWVGSVRWTADLCPGCREEHWGRCKGLVAAGLGDVTYAPVSSAGDGGRTA